MMASKNNTHQTLIAKLQRVADGESVELTKAEAALYGVDVADILPDEDLGEEKEVSNGK
ncbi:MAG: hypothetical protein AAGC65_07910 [Mucilaginibacter sp.]|uniref:hypothetical protein n=1 Tax=Mucilaginibacter sp. TaxID=1882438 RepID=UPI0031ACFEB1